MLITIWYNFMKHNVKIAFYFYFKKIKIYGKENIPKKGAILFVSNHPNALLDPLLIKTHTYKHLSVLTRAGVFKNKFIIKLFDSFKMIPIYRKRDGWNAISKNEAIFNKCYALLNEQKSILIFPEGSHSILKKVRPLSKGFAKIIFGAFEKYPDLEIQIVPVGLNYSAPTKYGSSAAVYFGKPFNPKKYYNTDDLLSSLNTLRDVTHDHMKVLTTHIEGDVDTYNKTLEILRAIPADFSDPHKTNALIKTIDINTSVPKKKKSSIILNPLYYLVILNNLIPWLLWKKAKPTIKDIVFTSTFRFMIGFLLIPITYCLQTLLIYFIFDKPTALIYLAFSLITCYILPKTLNVND